MADTGPQPPTPAIRVIGPASPEDVAVVVAVLAAASTDGAPDPPPEVSTWSSHATTVRRPLPHGRGAWRTTYRH